MYRATLKFFRLDGEGTYLGYNVVTRDIKIGAKGNVFFGAGVGKAFDTVGTQTGVFCVAETGKRMVVEE